MSTDANDKASLMTVLEVAEAIRQHPATVYRKVHSGEIPAVRLGSGPARAALRIPRDELAGWLEERRTLNDVSEGDGSRQPGSFAPAQTPRSATGPPTSMRQSSPRSSRGIER